MSSTRLFLVAVATLTLGLAGASPFIFGSDQPQTGGKLAVSVGLDSNPIAIFFDLIQIASDRFQSLLSKLGSDGARTVNSSAALFVNSMNATFELVKGVSIRTVDEFVAKASELQAPLGNAVSAGWDLVADLFGHGQFMLALPVTAFTVYLKTILGALTALRFQLDAGVSLGGSSDSNSTTMNPTSK